MGCAQNVKNGRIVTEGKRLTRRFVNFLRDRSAPACHGILGTLLVKCRLLSPARFWKSHVTGSRVLTTAKHRPDTARARPGGASFGRGRTRRTPDQRLPHHLLRL